MVELNQRSIAFKTQIILQMVKLIVSLLLIISLAYSQGCLNAKGTTVAWWVVMKVPPKIGKIGYGYYDSTMKTGKFIYIDAKIDEGNTSLTLTQKLINSLKLEHVAWNDEKPTGETSESMAHSKGLLAYSSSSAKGFLLTHSIPKYPGFTYNQINPEISPAQNVYGQHLACFSMNVKELDDMISNMLITYPFVYQNTISSSTNNPNIYRWANSIFPRATNLFNKHDLKTTYGYTLKIIAKNNLVNGSIFEDGLTDYLGVSPLVAETWGRPLQKAWCRGNKQVYNVINVNLNGIVWNEQDDHSKWVLAESIYACFGDMNRMTSQWKRGGSFFCLNEPTLVSAVKGMIASHDSC